MATSSRKYIGGKIHRIETSAGELDGTIYMHNLRASASKAAAEQCLDELAEVLVKSHGQDVFVYHKIDEL